MISLKLSEEPEKGYSALKDGKLKTAKEVIDGIRMDH